MSDDFADVKDSGLREQCLGFVEQLKSGKPAGVINMVMKSRGVTDVLITRINKAAGGSGGAPAAAAKPAKEKKSKSSSSASSSAASASASPPVAAAAAAPPAPAPVAAAAASSSPSASSSLTADQEKEKRKKEKREKKERAKTQEFSPPASSSGAAYTQKSDLDRMSSIEALSSSKKVKILKPQASSQDFAQRHLGVQPAAAPAPVGHQRRASQQVKLKAYDDGDGNEKMFGGAEPKPKDGCSIM